MPYIRNRIGSRAVVDPLIDEIVWRVSNEYSIETMGDPLRFICACLVPGVHRRIDFTLLKYAYFSDPVKNLVRLICDEFVQDQQKGVLNYCLTRIIVGSYIPTTPCPPAQWSYARCEDVMDVFANAEADAETICHQMGVPLVGIRGVYRCAAAEFYRRVIAPKEDLAITDNGDIVEYHVPAPTDLL